MVLNPRDLLLYEVEERDGLGEEESKDAGITVPRKGGGLELSVSALVDGCSILELFVKCLPLEFVAGSSRGGLASRVLY